MRQLDIGLWVWEKSFSLLGADIGNRMTVMDVGDGHLLLHSPVVMDEHVRDAVRALGTVRWIVTPNVTHGLFVKEWLQSFPGARYLAAPGARIKAQAYAEPLADGMAHYWAHAVDVIRIAGVPKLNEFAFLHRPTRSLILTDLVFNLPKDIGWWPQMMLRTGGMFGTFGPSRALKGMIEDLSEFRTSLHKVLQWDFERVIMSHGAIAAHSGKSLMVHAFAEYLQALSSRTVTFGLRSDIRCG